MTIIALYKQANASDFNTPSPVGPGRAWLGWLPWRQS